MGSEPPRNSSRDGDLGSRLVECEQELATMHDLELRLERTTAEKAALSAELETTSATLASVLSSPSWRLTEPLRRARRAIARLRKG